MPIVKQLKQHKILLDTHVWIWLMEGDSRLTDNFLKAVEHNQDHSGIFISPITIWEIGMLVEKERISIEMDVLDWIDQSLSGPGINLCPISPLIAIQSTRLPGIVLGDPADRLLVATAFEENAVLVTCDKKLLSYGKGRFISVYNPEKI